VSKKGLLIAITRPWEAGTRKDTGEMISGQTMKKGLEARLLFEHGETVCPKAPTPMAAPSWQLAMTNCQWHAKEAGKAKLMSSSLLLPFSTIPYHGHVLVALPPSTTLLLSTPTP